MAVRRNEKTIRILVKDVISIRIEGARVTIVMNAIICRVTATSSGFAADSSPKRKAGKGRGSAAAAPNGIRSIKRVTISVFLLISVSP
jgi:hypothetical protein